MAIRETPGPRVRRNDWLLLVGALVAVVAIATGHRSVPRASASTVPLPTDATRTVPQGALGAPDGALPSGRRGRLGTADGVLPDGTTVFDDDVPGIANLDADLLEALRRAASRAAQEGIQIVVESGWRSRDYQAQLLRDAVSEYGSAEEAARWVATPATSPHVLGDAVDVGPADAAAWLSAHGAGYGLCQIYRNEPWHFELRAAAAVDGGCPRMYADPTRDPRMQG